jgi:16S rRNA G966 N2-methylase RsmD
LILFCADYQYNHITKVLGDFNLHYDHLYWIKPDISGTSELHYVSAVENIVVIFNPKRSVAHFNFTQEDKHLNWIECPSIKTFFCYMGKVVNHSEKPQALLTQLIEHHSRPGDLVVDLFSGSGSATAAALMAERKVFAVELSDSSVEAIKARVPLLCQIETEKEEEESEIPEEDPKDKNQKLSASVEEKVCFLCGKGPAEKLTICASCGNLGHASCTPFYTDPNYKEDDRENTFWCSKEHFDAICESMLN